MKPQAREQAIVVFTVAGHPYAIPTTRTREVVAWRTPRPLPGADAWIDGVINLRGEIIPVCDLAQALGVGRRGALTLDTSIVIVETVGECVGLVVDGVRDVLTITPDELLDPGTGRHPALTGILNRDGDLIVLLDPDEAISGGTIPIAELIASVGADSIPEIDTTTPAPLAADAPTGSADADAHEERNAA